MGDLRRAQPRLRSGTSVVWNSRICTTPFGVCSRRLTKRWRSYEWRRYPMRRLYGALGLVSLLDMRASRRHRT
jgi:hypothetical protein